MSRKSEKEVSRERRHLLLLRHHRQLRLCVSIGVAMAAVAGAKHEWQSWNYQEP
jgi:hypothetical protein